jgi:hypothetical protein
LSHIAHTHNAEDNVEIERSKCFDLHHHFYYFFAVVVKETLGRSGHQSNHTAKNNKADLFASGLVYSPQSTCTFFYETDESLLPAPNLKLLIKKQSPNVLHFVLFYIAASLAGSLFVLR